MDWLLNERDNEVEIWCSRSKTKYGVCEWDGLWPVKWMRWKWMTKWMSWTLVHKMNRWTLVYEMRWKWLGRYITYWLHEKDKWILCVSNGAKWLSVRLGTKWLCDRFSLQLRKCQILCLVERIILVTTCYKFSLSLIYQYWVLKQSW